MRLPWARLGPAFQRLWWVTAVSDSANGVFWVASSLLAATRFRSPVAVGAVTVAATLPWLVAAVPVGVVVDTFDRRRIAVVGNTGRALVMLVVAAAVFTGTATVALLVAGVFVVGVLQTAVDASAEAMVPELVDGGLLTEANGAIALSTRVFYQFAGPIAAGSLLGLQAVAPFAVAGVGCLAATTLLLRGRWPPTSPHATVMAAGPRPGGRPRLLTGLRLTLCDPVLATVVLVGGVTTIANNAFLTGFVLYANAPGPLGLSPAEYGLLLSAIGVGAGLGTVLTARIERRLGRRAVMWLTRVGWASTMAGPLALDGPALAVVLALGSALGGMYGVQAMRIRQQAVAPEQRGQVFAASRMLSYGAAPVGAAVGGVALVHLDARTLFAICAAVTLATVVPLTLWIKDG